MVSDSNAICQKSTSANSRSTSLHGGVRRTAGYTDCLIAICASGGVSHIKSSKYMLINATVLATKRSQPFRP